MSASTPTLLRETALEYQRQKKLKAIANNQRDRIVGDTPIHPQLMKANSS